MIKRFNSPLLTSPWKGEGLIFPLSKGEVEGVNAVILIIFINYFLNVQRV